MKKTLFLTIAFVLGWLTLAMAQVWVNPYTRKDGTQVQGHYGSNPAGNPYNNWSYPGTVNPRTGKQATGAPNRSLAQYQNRNGSSYAPHSNTPTTYNPNTAYRR